MYNTIAYLNEQCLTLYSIGYFQIITLVSFLDNSEKIKKNLSIVSNTFENIVENGTYAPFSVIFSI